MTKAVTKALAGLLIPVQRKLRFALLLAIAAAGCFVVQSYLLAELFAAWLNEIAAAQPINQATLQQLLPWLLASLLLRPCLQFGREWLCQQASLQTRAHLRQQLLSKLAQLGPNRQRFGADGELAAKVLEHTDALDGYISRYYVQRYLVVIVPLLLVVATAFYSLLAASIMLVTAPLVPLFMVLVGHAAARKNQQQFAAMSRMAARFLDLSRGMLTLKRLNALPQAQRQVDYAADAFQHGTFSVLKLAFLSGAILEFFASLAIALLALYLGLGLLGVLPWAKGSIPVAYQGALFILLLAPEFYAPLRQLGNDYHAKAQAEGAIMGLLPLLHNHSTEQLGHSPIVLHDAPTLTLLQLSVTSPEGRQRLTPIDLTCKSGDRMVITGRSGCGKSTLLQALCGFIDYQGRVIINDFDLHHLHPSTWRSQIGYLSQQSTILPGTVASNLRLADPTATDEALIQVLQNVHLWSVLDARQGLVTELGERGHGLSGGQLQRLAIAQLLLRKTHLWLLDEPCAHLDPGTAYQIHQLLGDVTQGSTVLLVSHQLIGLDWVNRVIKLDDPQLHTNEKAWQVCKK